MYNNIIYYSSIVTYAYLVPEKGMMVPVPDVSSPTPNQVTKVSSKERGHS